MYEACREGLKDRTDIVFDDKHFMGRHQTKRNFLEDMSWANFGFPDCMVLVQDVIPMYDADFQGTHVYWHPKFEALQQFERVLVPSNWTKQTLVEDLNVDENRVDVVPLGVNRDVFKRMNVDLFAWRKKYGLPEHCQIIGHASYGYTRKNVERVLRAMANLENDHLIFVKVGRDNQTAMWADMTGMEHRVHYLPQLNDVELAEFYNAIDVFAFPSTSEGFGLPPLEAQACGCPVLISGNDISGRAGALSELNGPTAVLVDPFSVASITSALKGTWTRKDPMAPEFSAWLDRFKWENTGAAVNSWLH